MFSNNKQLWQWIVQTAIAILTAFATAIGASACVAHF